MIKLNVLVACEESQVVCTAFRENGHNAFSCDIQECSGGHPEWHVNCDVRNIINGECSFETMDGNIHNIDTNWDLILAFPPCTHIAVSGASYFEKKRNDGRQLEGIKFFKEMLEAECEYIMVENPINIIGGKYIKKWFPEYSDIPKYNQIIQPYEYGHPVSKKTCLWLKNLPHLESTNIVVPEMRDSNGKTGGYSGNSWCCVNERGKQIKWADPRTAKIRSRTYDGIGKAIADQYGTYVVNEINNKE